MNGLSYLKLQKCIPESFKELMGTDIPVRHLFRYYCGASHCLSIFPSVNIMPIGLVMVSVDSVFDTGHE